MDKQPVIRVDLRDNNTIKQFTEASRLFELEQKLREKETTLETALRKIAFIENEVNK